MTARGIKPTYACVPRRLLIRPAIVGRGEPAADALTVFEAALAIALLALARTKASAALNPSTTPKRKRSRLLYRAVPSEPVTIKITDHALLRTAGLSTNARNRERVGQTLERLRRPIRSGGARLIERFGSGTGATRYITISGRWMLNGRFGRVPVPLPTKGDAVLRLYLFLHGADQREDSATNHIALSELYARVGIRETRPSHAWRRLQSALAVVNGHLKQLNKRDALEEAHLLAQFHIVRLTGEQRGRVRFQAVPSDNVPLVDVPADDSAETAYAPEIDEEEQKLRQRRVLEEEWQRKRRARDEWAVWAERMRDSGVPKIAGAENHEYAEWDD